MLQYLEKSITLKCNKYKRKRENNMILLGIMAIIIGGMLYYSGNAINNDIDAQMESIFNNGVSNPGSSYETIGSLLLVVGFALLIIGVFISVNKKNDEDDELEINIKTDFETPTIEEKKLQCKKCGKMIAKESKFCMECGEPFVPENEEVAIVCPSCRSVLPEGSKFCMYCGKDVPNGLK